MKVNGELFRDFDRRWVGIENRKSCKKIAKKLKRKELISPIFGYLFIDKEEGISLRIVGNFERDYKYRIFINEDFLEDDLIIDYEFMKKIKLDVEIIDEEIIKNVEGTNIISNKIDSEYKNINNFLSTREFVYLDKFRDERYPDDIEAVLENKEQEVDEYLYVTIEGIMDKRPDLLIAKLDDSSEYNEDYKEGDYVAIKYYEDEDLVKIYGHLKRREEE
ncbi:MAG: hypothetical protein IKQ35_00070 [Bacilli bacterium]|nr:hypothetical protein [Bacilli bacterium]